jgi:HAD superfamily hydrolase (TIGR01456 family)
MDSLPDNTTAAFAFDIDGVFVRSKMAIPGGGEAVATLKHDKVPFIFLTNGGGKTEREHVELVGRRLKIQLDADQFVQSHTPFRSLVDKFGDKTILVLGGIGSSIRDVPHSYGFKKVLTTSDLLKMQSEHVYPFLEATKDHHNRHGQIHPPEYLDTEDGCIKISAIMIWSSPRDLGLDLQVALDLLLSSGGRFGTFSPKNGDSTLPNNGYLQDDQPKIYVCNPDLTWATAYHHPRFAQGMFKAYLEGGWNALTKGADLSSHIWICGKPTRETYLYAEKTLLNYHTKINGPDAPEIKTIYMVGDNPESDIRGANNFISPTGIEWKSILVRTGVYKEGTVPEYTPTKIVNDVKAAVEWGISDSVKVGVGVGMVSTSKF